MSRALIIAGVLLVVATLVFWLWPEASREVTQDNQGDTSGQSNAQQAQALNDDLSSDSESFEDADETALEDPFEEAAIQAQLLQVADLYEQTTQFPHYSQPILNPDQVREPEPFAETEVDTPFPLDDFDEPVRLQAAVDRYQYFQGDVIQARLKIIGAPSDTYIQAVGTLTNSTGQDSGVQEFSALDQSFSEFMARFDSKVIPTGLVSTEMLLKVNVTIGEEELFTTVPFRFSNASAQLQGLGGVSPQAEYLTVPLQYAVFTSGYYFARAILEDASSGQPLLQLQAEGPMSAGNGVLTLKAHIKALKAMASEGPYVLRSINTYRGAERGENYDVPASSVAREFAIPAFSFDQYEDVDYVDELAQERLEFLRSAGAISDEE